MTANRWILKVLSGTHVGAEVLLSAEESVLGKDESCDLILDDVSLSNRHLSLRVDENKAVLKLLDANRPIYVDDEKFEGESIVLEPFQVITVGTLFLAAGPAEVEWPTIDLLLEKKIESREAVHDEAVPGDQSPDAGADDTAGVQTVPPPARSRRVPYAYALSALVGMVGVAVWLLSPTKVDRPRLSRQQTAELRRLLAHYGAAIQIQRADTAGQLPQITGYVDTELNRQRLAANIVKINSDLETDIVAAEGIQQALSIVLDHQVNQDKNNSVEVVSVPYSPGDFIVRGYVRDADTWETALQALHRDGPNYNSLKDEVQTQKDRVRALQNMLLEADLDQVQIETTEQGLILPGNLKLEEQKKLTAIIHAFNKKFNSRPPLATDLDEDGMPESSVELDIRSISFGVIPHIIMRDGQRYSQGAQLANGYTIVSITPDFIALKKGPETAYYHLRAEQ